MAITAAAVAVVVVLPYYPPVLVCTWHMIRSSRISCPPDRSIALSLQYTPGTNPHHTRSTSYLQYSELIKYHTVPLGSNLSLLCGPSPPRLPVLRACAEPQAGVSPPRRSSSGILYFQAFYSYTAVFRSTILLVLCLLAVFQMLPLALGGLHCSYSQYSQYASRAAHTSRDRSISAVSTGNTPSTRGTKCFVVT